MEDPSVLTTLHICKEKWLLLCRSTGRSESTYERSLRTLSGKLCLNNENIKWTGRHDFSLLPWVRRLGIPKGEDVSHFSLFGEPWSFINFPHFIPIQPKTLLPWTILVSGWWYIKNLLFWNWSRPFRNKSESAFQIVPLSHVSWAIQAQPSDPLVRSLIPQ